MQWQRRQQHQWRRQSYSGLSGVGKQCLQVVASSIDSSSTYHRDSGSSGVVRTRIIPNHSRSPSSENAMERMLSVCSCVDSSRLTEPAPYWWLRHGKRGSSGNPSYSLVAGTSSNIIHDNAGTFTAASMRRGSIQHNAEARVLGIKETLSRPIQRSYARPLFPARRCPRCPPLRAALTSGGLPIRVPWLPCRW